MLVYAIMSRLTCVTNNQDSEDEEGVSLGVTSSPSALAAKALVARGGQARARPALVAPKTIATEKGATAKLVVSDPVYNAMQMGTRLEKVEAQLEEMLAGGGDSSRAGKEYLGEDDYKSQAAGFIRSEMSFGNISLASGGMRSNAETYGTCWTSFQHQLRRNKQCPPVDATKIFRKCFAAVVKSERRRLDPTRMAKALQGNRQRLYRWRLSEKMLACWGLMTSEDEEPARKAKGAVVLASQYMPEITVSERTMTYLPLLWLSDEAKRIQAQVFKCMKYDRNAYTCE